VALAKLALGGATFLLLDEPTNHLDIDSQEILQAVLEAFDGTILIVSHDRYLIDALATQVWAAEPGSLTVYRGTYQEYLAMRAGMETFIGTSSAATPTNGSAGTRNGASADNVTPTGDKETPAKKHGLNPYQLKKRVAELEAQIHTLETKLTQITAQIEAASAVGKIDQVGALGEQYTETEWALDQALSAWAELAE
jgi:ATP-binding cassette subfamily F protein 3